MTVFDYTDYKKFTNDFIKLRAHNGRGQYLKLSKVLSVHTTMISHIFKGDKDLTPEHAVKVCSFLGLNELEREYFMTLVQRARAGSSELRTFYNKQIDGLMERSKKVGERLQTKHKLSESDKAMFYSSWFYSAIRILTSIPAYQSKDKILNIINLPNETTSNAIEFLLKTGLCVMDGEKLKNGPAHTHVDQNSPLVYKHHLNWRLKAFERHERLLPEELMFTAPLSIGQKDIEKVRSKILNFIQEVKAIVDETDPDKMCCLNIDWFKII